MREYTLRYYEKEDRYLVEVRDEAYFELDKQIRRLKKNLECLPDESAAEREKLELRRAKLRVQRQKMQKYIPLAPGDIPAGICARPLHSKPENIVSLSGEEYEAMLHRLAAKKGMEVEA